MNRQFTIRYHCSDGNWTSLQSIAHSPNCKSELIAQFSKDYEGDQAFKIESIVSLPNGSIDWELMDRMKACQEMVDLGNKKRAEIKIRKRQPLRIAYVLFSNPSIQDHMMFLDKNNEYTYLFSEEFNVDSVEFVEETERFKFFDVSLKPNFRSLGPKGYGKLAQQLKKELNDLTSADRSNLYHTLSTGKSVDLLGIPLTIGDVEVEYSEKVGYAATTGKVGALIIDTTLTPELLERGLVADFRTAVQNIRKNAKLALTDRIYLEVYCSDERIKALTNHLRKLNKDLLSIETKFFPIDKVNQEAAHKVELIDEEIYVVLYKDNI